MIKRIIYYIIIVAIIFVGAYLSHENILVKNEWYLSFSLLDVYLFHAIAACIVYVIIEVLVKKLPTQAGYAYLAAIFLKIGLFVLIFQDSIMANDSLSRPERISLVVPLFLFLILEAVGVSKLLNSK